MNYICEAEPNCRRVQSAICLHCHRRLCLEHLTEHNSATLNHLSNLSNEIQLTLEQINNENVKRRQACDENLHSLNQWHDEQRQQLEQTYERRLNSIQVQREILAYEESKLFHQLEQDAFQPLKQLQDQGIINNELINQIQHVIDTVRQANFSLQQRIIVPTPATGPVNNQLPTNSNSNIRQKRTNRRTKLPIGRPYKRLISMFSNLRSIAKSKRLLGTYIKNEGPRLNIPSFICSYLTSWHRKQNVDDKTTVLDEYIPIVRQALVRRRKTLALLGIQSFFHLEEIHENKTEMMEFLLKFFLDCRYINQKTLLDWFNGTRSTRPDFLKATQFAKPFVESL